MAPALFRDVKHPDCTYEAIQLPEDRDAWTAIAEWCGGEVRQVQLPGGDPYPVLYIGNDGAVAGDWIVHQASGFYVWVPEAFPRYFQPA
jgi:hypothetical protein